jgi:hypothetical protein
MKVIKFEVSFRSDGSVASLVARQAEVGGPQMLRGSLWRALWSPAVRSVLGTAGVQVGLATRLPEPPQS